LLQHVLIALPENAQSDQGGGAGAKAILDGWSRRQKLLNGGAEARA